MHRVLIHRPAKSARALLPSDMKKSELDVDVSSGMLEMMRRIQENEYDVVVLHVGGSNMDVCTLVEMIRALGKRTKIALNLAELEDASLSILLSLDCPVIRGALTSDKLMEIAQAGP